MKFIRKRVQKIAKVIDIRNFFNSQKEVDTLALDDVSQSELLIVENEIKKSNQVNKNPHHQCPRKDQNRGWSICSDSGNQSCTVMFQ